MFIININISGQQLVILICDTINQNSTVLVEGESNVIYNIMCTNSSIQ